MFNNQLDSLRQSNFNNTAPNQQNKITKKEQINWILDKRHQYLILERKSTGLDNLFNQYGYSSSTLLQYSNNQSTNINSELHLSINKPYSINDVSIKHCYFGKDCNKKYILGHPMLFSATDSSGFYRSHNIAMILPPKFFDTDNLNTIPTITNYYSKLIQIMITAAIKHADKLPIIQYDKVRGIGLKKIELKQNIIILPDIMTEFVDKIKLVNPKLHANEIASIILNTIIKNGIMETFQTNQDKERPFIILPYYENSNLKEVVFSLHYDLNKMGYLNFIQDVSVNYGELPILTTWLNNFDCTIFVPSNYKDLPEWDGSQDHFEVINNIVKPHNVINTSLTYITLIEFKGAQQSDGANNYNLTEETTLSKNESSDEELSSDSDEELSSDEQSDAELKKAIALSIIENKTSNDNKALEQKVIELTLNMSQLESERDVYRNKLEETEENLAATSKSLEEVNMHHKELNKLYLELDELHRTLQKSLAEKDQENDLLKKKNAKTIELISGSKSENLSLSLERIINRVTISDEQNSKLLNQQVELKEQNNLLQEQLKALQKENAELKKAMQKGANTDPVNSKLNDTGEVTQLINTESRSSSDSEPFLSYDSANNDKDPITASQIEFSFK